MKLKILSPITINRIAAGEVIERPASAVKELLENALDANATTIEVILHQAGRNLISVRDNGTGMNKEELSLCVERHSTSKLDETDLLNIQFFGFRGEALPSIGSVSRMIISSKAQGATDGYAITIDGGIKGEISPAAHNHGTTIEIRDLFFATPARLKFLKSERTEQQYIVDIVNRLSLAHPTISFSLKSEQRNLIKFTADNSKIEEAKFKRVAEVLGANFLENALEINAEREGIALTGYVSLPSFNRGNSLEQYFYVNNRPVKDKLLSASIRVAYQDVLASNRYPIILLFLNIPFEEVDVNVHPTKAEVRFRDSNLIKSLIISGIREAISNSSMRSNTNLSERIINAFIPSTSIIRLQLINNYQTSQVNKWSGFAENSVIQDQMNSFSQPQMRAFDDIETPALSAEFPLGAATAQLHLTYIITQTEDGIVIVDQHAAHERLVYEKLKTELANNEVKKQRLLIPAIIEVSEYVVDKILKNRDELAKLGLIIEPLGLNAIMITEIPAILNKANLTLLIQDLADDLLELGENITTKDRIDQILSSMACNNSVRAGRKLNIQEMNDLLREMENTPLSGQCNHGRPTFIKLKLDDIEKLFGRT